VGTCHCTECQRRTGSPFGVSTYFPKPQVRTEGPCKVYVRGSDSGRKIEFHFCPDCGSAVFWYAEVLPGLIGIAYGAFPDPSMPRPTLSVWETTRHPWVTFDHQLDRFTVQPKIDDLDLERPSHGGANVRNGKVCVSDRKWSQCLIKSGERSAGLKRNWRALFRCQVGMATAPRPLFGRSWSGL
jgi:hypothetical protein